MEISNNYFVRRPLIGLDLIEKIYSAQENELEELIMNLCKEDYIRESLLIGSYDLYKQIRLIEQGVCRISKNVLISVVKYLLRMASRPMPYGLFAGITSKNFNCDELENEKRKIIRVSSEWVLNVSKKIEQMQNINSTLLISKSELLRETPDYFYIDISQQEEEKRILIQKNAFITNLIRLLGRPMNISDLLSDLSNEQMNLKPKALNLIKSLLEKNILISELRPNAIIANTDNFNWLLENKTNIDNDMLDKLMEVKNLLKNYQETKLGEGESSYISLINAMKGIEVSKRFLVIDLLLESENIPLNKSEVQEVIREIDFLKLFNRTRIVNVAFQDYSMKFLDKYGLYNEISLMELLDNDSGLGFPNMSVAELDYKKETEYNAFLFNLINKTLRDNETTIKLKSNDIEKIKSIYASSNNFISDGYDVKLNKITENNKSKYILGDNSFGHTSLSFTGRFKIHSYEDVDGLRLKYKDNEYISAEINTSPLCYSDIGVTSILPEYQININSITHNKKVIDIGLEDIVIGMDKNGMYAKSILLEKKILPVSTHMLFYANFNENRPLLFLSLFKTFLTQLPMDFYLGGISTLESIPRIEYKNIILSPRRWNINIDVISNKSDDNEMKSFIKNFIKENSVDNLVSILQGDRALPVRTNSDFGIEIILHSLKKNKGYSNFLTLIEAPELQRKENFNRDFIITVLPESSRSEKSVGNGKKIHTQGVDNFDFNWRYYKLYWRKGQKVKLIIKVINFLKEMKVEKYFFINYKDSRDHIRFRFICNETNVIELFEELLKELVQKQYLSEYTSSLFQPEINRYGGNKLYDHANQYFCYESEIYYLVENFNLIKYKSELEKGIIICINTIIDLFQNYKEALAFFDQLTTSKNKKYLKEFNKNRKYYNELMMDGLKSYHSNLLYKNKRLLARSYTENIKSNFNKERQFYILSSIVHMSINRFIGIDRELENKIYEYSRYTFYNMKYELELLGGYNEFL
ncbi:thiopeptide-type bacteriocin biosynthesis protein [Heyndrickxia acidicola]|uniref:thiopeptide-type bacteriocin biosynthesis protein n=1 Tax=Heyndrickxia acidicola TaxID=209389 RepID=UPI0008260040|nr:thiopeptide-type bacteriocin biosynthesis protein [Heyndrickxia acidicola]